MALFDCTFIFTQACNRTQIQIIKSTHIMAFFPHLYSWNWSIIALRRTPHCAKKRLWISFSWRSKNFLHNKHIYSFTYFDILILPSGSVFSEMNRAFPLSKKKKLVAAKLFPLFHNSDLYTCEFHLSVWNLTLLKWPFFYMQRSINLMVLTCSTCMVIILTHSPEHWYQTILPTQMTYNANANLNLFYTTSQTFGQR